MARIKEKRTAIVCPTIDGVDKDTMAYHISNGAGYGEFTWSLYFTWSQLPERIRKEMKSPNDPYPSVTMAGGLLAADREYFFEIGGYDDGMVELGLNLSFYEQKFKVHFKKCL